MPVTEPAIDLLDLVDPARYSGGYPHETWAALRRSSPVHWCEIDGFDPFWAVTRHADVKHVSTHPLLFSSEQRLFLVPSEEQRRAEESPMANARTLLNTDPPVHRGHRAMAGAYFRPRTLSNLEDRMRDLTRLRLDQFAAQGPGAELDFATELAPWHPLKMIAEILGVAEKDEPTMLRIANELFGLTDPEFARDRMDLLTEAFGFLMQLVADKRADPKDDLASVIVHSTLDGEPAPDMAVIGYLLILITAGHDTTKNAIAGGMLALIENPDQLELLRARPELCAQAADEIVRWTTPVTHFMRTATEDCELGGQKIRAGDGLTLFYPSANRDEHVFDDPFAFRVDRDPNPHLGWGIGEHYCLGASLAKMEIRLLLEELVPRLDGVELAGEPEWLASNFVSGVKHLPIRWTLRP